MDTANVTLFIALVISLLLLWIWAAREWMRGRLSDRRYGDVSVALPTICAAASGFVIGWSLAVVVLAIAFALAASFAFRLTLPFLKDIRETSAMRQDIFEGMPRGTRVLYVLVSIPGFIMIALLGLLVMRMSR